MEQYVSGANWGWDESVKVHVTANIVGDKITVGPNTRIDGQVTITGDVQIGRNCHLAVGCSLFGGEGIVIGDHCGVSAGVRIFTGTDDPDLGVLALHSENELARGAKVGMVLIEDYVTIGANCVIYPGVRLGRACMVGALSFVNSNLEVGWIYAGCPARGLRPRPPLKYRDGLAAGTIVNTGGRNRAVAIPVSADEQFERDEREAVSAYGT